MADIGFIGLGIMGKPMVRNLMNAGNSVTVYDIVGTAVEEMATEGATPASSSSEVAAKNSLIITMVPDSADSEAAILGPNGVLEGAASGSVVIDMSSIAPASSQKIAAGCETQGVDFLDAPVSGGEPGAVSGTLAIMVGGKKDVYDKCLDVFAPMGSATFCGDYGAGNTTKLANQIMVAINIAAVGEALVLAKKAGLDPNVVFDAVKGGTRRQQRAQRKGTHDDRGQLQSRLPHQPAPEGPQQRLADRARTQRSPALHGIGAAGHRFTDERRQGRRRPLRHRQLHRRYGADEN